MHAMKLPVQAMRTVLASGARGALSLVGEASQQCWGVTAGKASHKAINARGVTAGKMGRNSSNNNHKTYLTKIKRKNNKEMC